MKMINEIIDYLDEIIPNPRCELNYSKDYELLISVMLSAQTTDKRVNEVTNVLYKKYKTIDRLSNAEVEDIMDIIKPIGTFRKKASNVKMICKKLLADYNGVVPNERTYLESLPGVGRKTANVVLSNLYNIPCIAVDTHVSRVSKRLGLAKNSDDVYQIEKKLNKLIPKENMCRMHHQLVLFGRYYCKAKNPNCIDCKLKNICKKKDK